MIRNDPAIIKFTPKLIEFWCKGVTYRGEVKWAPTRGEVHKYINEYLRNDPLSELSISLERDKDNQFSKYAIKVYGTIIGKDAGESSSHLDLGFVPEVIAKDICELLEEEERKNITLKTTYTNEGKRKYHEMYNTLVKIEIERVEDLKEQRYLSLLDE